MNSIKARLLQSASFSATTAADLDTAVNAWLTNAGEKSIVEVLMGSTGGTFLITILYTVG